VRPTLIRAPGIIAPALVLLLALNGVRAVAHEHAYIPKDLTDAHRELIRLFSPNGVAEIKALKDEKGAYTIPIGIELTNRWQLNSNSRLAKYFHRLGVQDSHDMVGIVMATFWDRLHHRPLGLSLKVARLNRYYAARMKLLPRGTSPKDGAKIDWIEQQESEDRILSLGISTSDGSYWRYDSSGKRGIEPARPEEVKELKLDAEPSWRHPQAK